MSNELLHIKRYFYLLKLIRADQPIGFFLLLWPTLWGLWLSNRGCPDIFILGIFVFGVLFMRSAGCIMNDYVDCNIDRLVQRTRKRPLSTGLIKKKEAFLLLLILLVLAMVMVCTLNFVTIILALIAFLLAGIYPYLKRYIYCPQLILGILFSWPILMVFTATNHSINYATCLLFIINTVWTIIYDTQYAMVDREDDKRIGIKSTAIFFGKMDKFIIGFFQVVVIFLLWVFSWLENLSMVFYIFAIFGTMLLFLWQQMLIFKRDQKRCFLAFLSNNYVGMSIFMGIAFSLY